MDKWVNQCRGRVKGNAEVLRDESPLPRGLDNQRMSPELGDREMKGA